MIHKLSRHFLKTINRTIGGQKYLSLQIDITNTCNLRCSHCYHSHHKNKGALSLNQWQQIIDQYQALIDKLLLEPEITICGGEPTLSPLLFPLLEYIQSKFGKLPINILSNGTTINEGFLKRLEKYNVHFQISLDGPDKKRHNSIRGSCTFEKAVNGIQLLHQFKVPISVLAVLSEKTAPWVKEFFKLAKELNVESMNFTRFIPAGHGRQLQLGGGDDVLIGTELKRAYESIVFYSEHYGVFTNTNKPLFHLIDPKLGMSGKFGFQGLVVDYKGNLKVSSRADYVLGSVLEMGLENLFLNHPVLKQLRKGEIKVCGKCPFYSRCGGDRNMSYAVTGSFLSQDIGCWQMPSEKSKQKETFHEVG